VISEIFSDTKHRAVSLPQLNFLRNAKAVSLHANNTNVVSLSRVVTRILIRRGISLPPLASLPLSVPSPLSPLSLPSPMIQLGDLGERCKLLQRVRTEPERQTIIGEFRAYNQALDNNYFDWIFNQLTVKSLHKLIYIERPLN